MWRRPLEWNLNGTTDPRDGSVDHLSLNSLKDHHGPIRAPKSCAEAAVSAPVAMKDALGLNDQSSPIRRRNILLRGLRPELWSQRGRRPARPWPQNGQPGNLA